MAPSDAATWWGVVVAALFGIAGLVVGLIGLHHARKASEAAALANLVAKGANDLSRQSNNLAADANALSQRANGYAEEANDLAKSGHGRAIEQHDVRWEARWVAPGMYVLKNAGLDTAYSVRVQITVDDEVESAEVAQCPPQSEIRMEMPKSREALERENERDKRVGTTRSGAGWLIVGGPIKRDTHHIRERVFWRTALGTPKEHDQVTDNGRLAPPESKGSGE